MTQSDSWPALPLAEWKDTYATLHMWTQIVGKVRLALSPQINHWWGATLYVTARGLTTSPIPYNKGIFEVSFDFMAHTLEITTSLGESRAFRLVPRTVAEFYSEFMGALHSLGIGVKVWPMPVEVPRPVRFNLDESHAAYDGEYAHRFWQILVSVDTVFWEFRSRFIGKVSPVHFFWGSFDLAVTRFSGRSAPPHPGGVPHLPDAIAREAYSQEVSSLGFWPGGGPMPMPVFYSYAYPEPAGFAQAEVQPDAASYNAQLHEFILPYDAVRTADSPDDVLLDFAQSTYDAASKIGKWDRAALEEVNHSLHSETPLL